MESEQKQYVCVCGKTFDNSQAFNGHRSNCKEYLGEEKYQAAMDRLKEASKKAKDAIRQKSEDFHKQKDEKEKQWVLEGHKCERCGQIMTEKYGTGRFCSQKCANSREHSDESRLKISESLRRYAFESANKDTRIFLDFSKYAPGTKDLYISGVVNYRTLKYYEIDKIEGIDYVICPYCGCRFAQLQAGHLKSHSKTIKDLKNEFRDKYQIVCQVSHEIKSAASKETQRQLVESGQHVGWQSRNIKSYPEVFWEQVLVNNHITYDPNHTVKKRDLGINDNSNYFLDFLIDDVIDLEIDGKQHQYEDRKQSDIIRDDLLQKNGFIIYRIPWVNPTNSEAVKTQIEDFLNWYNDIKINEKRIS